MHRLKRPLAAHMHSSARLNVSSEKISGASWHTNRGVADPWCRSTPPAHNLFMGISSVTKAIMGNSYFMNCVPRTRSGISMQHISGGFCQSLPTQVLCFNIICVTTSTVQARNKT